MGKNREKSPSAIGLNSSSFGTNLGYTLTLTCIQLMAAEYGTGFLSWVYALPTIPFVFSPFIGWLVDRMNPQQVMWVSVLSSVGALGIAIVLFVAHAPLTATLIIPSSVVTCTRIFHQFCVARLIKSFSDLSHRNNGNHRATILGRNLGSFFAALIDAIHKPSISLGIAISVFASVLWSGRKIPFFQENYLDNPRKKSMKSFLKEVSLGFSHIMREPSLRLATINNTVMTLSLWSTSVALLVYGKNALHTSSLMFAVMFFISGVGGVAGNYFSAAMVKKIAKKVNNTVMMSVGGLMQATAWLAMATYPQKWLFLSFFAAIVSGQILAGAHIQTEVQEKSNHKIQARVVAALNYPAAALTPVVVFFGGKLAGALEPQASFLLAAAVLTISFGGSAVASRFIRGKKPTHVFGRHTSSQLLGSARANHVFTCSEVPPRVVESHPTQGFPLFKTTSHAPTRPAIETTFSPDRGVTESGKQPDTLRHYGQSIRNRTPRSRS